ncbi:MAG: glycosyltransferase family 4 protein [Terracidiphilus sp.]|jgi:glycosyltransferase involved in cell wall biosynthesis
MKILILFSHLWHGGSAGGAETHATQLMQELSRRGHQIVLVTCSGKDEVEGMPAGVAAKYELPFHGLNPFDQIKVYRKLAEIVQKHSIEMIHAHHRTAGIFAECIFRGRHVPYVISMHDTWRRAPLKRLHGKFFRRLIAVSAYIKREMEKQYRFSPERIRVIHNGVDPAPFEKASREEAAQFRKKNGIEDEVVLSLIARVTRAKGHYTLVEALRLVPRELKLKCLIVGEGKEKQKLQQIVSDYGLDEKVRFTGFEANIPAVLQATDIMLLPSCQEPFGLALVEAMLSRTAVIASDSGAIPEIITHEQDGLLFRASDAAALARAIQRLVADKGLRQRLGEEGYRTAHRRFLLTRMVDDIEDYYSEIVFAATGARHHGAIATGDY